MYLEGHGVPKDINKAIYWFSRSADHENVWAQNNMGVMYHDGTGVPQDFNKAFQYYFLAATKGFSRGMLNVARMYLQGQGVLRDGEKAVEWYTKSSESGFKLADQEMKHAQLLCKEEAKLMENLKIEEWEKSKNLSPESLTNAERIERCKNGTLPAGTKL